MDIVVPQLGESVIEARVARWLKHEGDAVAAGDPLVELETDKIDLEVNAETAGVLSHIARKEGDDVKVGEVLGVVEQGASAQGASAPKGAGDQGPGASGQGPGSAQQAAGSADTAAGSRPQAAGSAPSTQHAASSTAPGTQHPAPSTPLRSTATAKRVAEEYGVDLSRVPGSGDGGRVTKEDVERHVAAAFAPAPGERASAPKGDSAAAISSAVVGPNFSSATSGTAPAAFAPAPAESASAPKGTQHPALSTVPGTQHPVLSTRSEERIRMSKRRATIAKRLVEAQHTAAMLTTFNEVDMTAVQTLRARRKEGFQKLHGVNLGLSSFFVKAAVGALKAFPRINAEIQGDEMVLKHYYDVGIAVGASTGLVVPVLRDADRMTFWQIEASIKDYAKRAEDGALTLEEIRGGTFTITNGGVFGSLLSTPILNPPQVGILGLHKIEERPVAVGGQVVIRPMMYVALSYDHRMVDGLEAVQFLVRIKEFIEDPGHLLIEG